MSYRGGAKRKRRNQADSCELPATVQFAWSVQIVPGRVVLGALMIDLGAVLDRVAYEQRRAESADRCFCGGGSGELRSLWAPVVTGLLKAVGLATRASSGSDGIWPTACT
jgi:hypothetical protein